MASSDNLPVLRISELSRRTGVPVPTIRGWERRYGYPEPARTSSGYRLYSEVDVRRIVQLTSLISSGMAVSQAVDVIRARPDGMHEHDSGERASGVEGDAPEPLAEQLASSLLEFDTSSAHELLDRAFGAFGVAVAMCDVALAAVRMVGEQWESGTATIAQEHFASNLVRGRLWSLSRGWDQGDGKRIVLAVTGGDHHDLPLLALGILLRERGWRVTWIGADTPAVVVGEASKTVRPNVVLVSMTGRSPSSEEAGELRQLALPGVRLAIAGPRADASLADEIGAVFLDGGPERVARELDVV